MTVNEMNEETTTDAAVDTADDTAPAAAAAEESTGDGADDESAVRPARKVREGLVVSDKMDKTAVVEVVDRVRHARYNKFILRSKKLYAHDETNDVKLGDRVRVMETRPLSKKKRWRVIDVLERAK